jgi:hypothetical protein
VWRRRRPVSTPRSAVAEILCKRVFWFLRILFFILEIQVTSLEVAEKSSYITYCQLHLESHFQYLQFHVAIAFRHSMVKTLHFLPSIPRHESYEFYSKLIANLVDHLIWVYETLHSFQ